MPRFYLVTIASIVFINLLVLVGFIYLTNWMVAPSILTNPTEMKIASDAHIVILHQNKLSHLHLYNLSLKKELCSDDAFLLLIIVCSAVTNTEQRMAIRETWAFPIREAANKGKTVRIAFLMGATSNISVSKALKEESARYGDVIQEEFIDSYYNLTLKSIMLLKWVNSYCPNVDYILKCDDDMYVNIPNLVMALRRLGSRTKSIFGVLFRKAKPNRKLSSKWHVPKAQFPGAVFPDYVSGTAYVITKDSVSLLYSASLKTPFVVMEDVFITGLCAQTAGIKRLRIKEFTHGRRRATGCSFVKAITGHHVTPKEMRKIWMDLQDPGIKCKRPDH